MIMTWDSLASQGHPVGLALGYAKVFWPDFVEVEGFVLVAEHYTDDYFNRILEEVGAAELEATINTTYLRDLFGDGDAPEATWETLGNLLTRTWKAKAEVEFPHRSFRSTFAWYSDIGDPGITIFHVEAGSRAARADEAAGR